MTSKTDDISTNTIYTINKEHLTHYKKIKLNDDIWNDPNSIDTFSFS